VSGGRRPGRDPARDVGCAALGVAAAILYGPVVAKLVRDWWASPDYSHAFIVLPFAAGLVWRRRAALRTAAPSPSSTGLAIACAAFALLLVGTLGVELFLTRLSLLFAAAGGVVFLFGWPHLRLLALPFALLLLTIPVPSVLLSHLTLSLQLGASRIAEAALNATGIPVLREGNVLVLPNATLQVAEACSGIRSLTALVTLGLLVAHLNCSHRLPRVTVVASAVPIAVLVNGLRVSASAIAARWYGPTVLDGAIHETLGWMMFACAFALMMVCAHAASLTARSRPLSA
jgi:exosortase